MSADEAILHGRGDQEQRDLRVENDHPKWQRQVVKAITIEELHRETERWVKEATDNGGIVITAHGSPVAELVQHGPVKRPRWLQEQLAANERLPRIATDSATYVSDDRERL